mmetsp:Transcript_42198/g.88242  ORF Transcript_42198/g.88242 Transcript_42198/m.88242 type:complete len:190 (-) Transcript_42198:605-1174(-)
MASRLAMLPKRHVGTHALMLDSVFTYHMDMKEAREERLKPEMRSSWGGALREAAEERAEDGIALPSGNSNRSKLQQQALAADALQRAATYSNEDLGKRGDSAGHRGREVRHALRNERVDGGQAQARGRPLHPELQVHRRPFPRRVRKGQEDARQPAQGPQGNQKRAGRCSRSCALRLRASASTTLQSVR